MGLQRHLKILGIFCRLKHRDGKPHYSEDLPRFFNYATKVANRYGPLRSLLNHTDRPSNASAIPVSRASLFSSTCSAGGCQLALTWSRVVHQMSSLPLPPFRFARSTSREVH